MMVEVKLNDLNGSKSLRRFVDLSSCASRHLSQMAGVVIYIFMDVPLLGWEQKKQGRTRPCFSSF